MIASSASHRLRIAIISATSGVMPNDATTLPSRLLVVYSTAWGSAL